VNPPQPLQPQVAAAAGPVHRANRHHVKDVNVYFDSSKFGFFLYICVCDVQWADKSCSPVPEAKHVDW
jgi:hypothetical protein